MYTRSVGLAPDCSLPIVSVRSLQSPKEPDICNPLRYNLLYRPLCRYSVLLPPPAFAVSPSRRTNLTMNVFTQLQPPRQRKGKPETNTVRICSAASALPHTEPLERLCGKSFATLCRLHRFCVVNNVRVSVSALRQGCKFLRMSRAIAGVSFLWNQYRGILHFPSSVVPGPNMRMTAAECGGAARGILSI
jgi:hypothetical protein